MTIHHRNYESCRRGTKRRAIVFLAASLICLIVGCSDRATPPNSKEGTVKFNRADVKLVFDDKGQLVNTVQRVIDPKAVEELAAFFPGLGTGKKSRMAGAWMANLQIEFYDADGTRHVVITDYNDWREGASGDFQANSGLREYIRRMFEPAR